MNGHQSRHAPEGPVDQEPADGVELRDPLPGAYRGRRAGPAGRRRSDVRRALRLQADHRQRLRARRGHDARHRALVRIPPAARRRDGDRHRGALLFRVLARRAHRRRHPPRGAPQPAAPVARLLRGEPAGRDHVADHGRHHDHRAGRRDHRLGRAAQPGDGRGLHRDPVRAGAQARGHDAARRPAGNPSDRLSRPQGARGVDPQPGPHRRRRHRHQRSARRDEDRPGVQPGGPRDLALHRSGRARLRDRQAAHPAARA